jgi:hypothetical protein
MKGMIIKTDRREGGQILIVVLILLLVGGLILSPLLYFMGTGLKAGQTDEKRTVELYSADAGARDALWQLEQATPDAGKVPQTAGQSLTYGYGTSSPLADVNGRRLTVTIYKQDSSTYKITSAAMAGGSTTTIVAYVSVIQNGFLFNNAITTVDGSLVFNAGNASVTGDVFVQNGSVTFPGNGSNHITGDVYSSGSITGRGSINGEIDLAPGSTVSSQVTHPNSPTYSTETFTTPDATMSALRTQIINRTSSVAASTVTTSNPADQSSATWSPAANSSWYKQASHPSYWVKQNVAFPSYGTVTFGSPSVSCPVYVGGSMTFSSSSVTFNGPVYVIGNMTFSSGNVVFNGPVQVDGTIYMSGSGSLTFNDTVKAGAIQKTSSASPVFNKALYVTGDFTFPAGSGNPIFQSTVYVGGDLDAEAGYVLTLPDALYVKGDLILNAGSYIKTAPTSPYKDIVVDGNITMSGGTALGDVSQIPLIMDLTPGASITMSGGANAYAAIYAPGASVQMNGNAQLTGALIAKTITLGNGGGSPGVTYDTDLINRSDLQGLGGNAGAAVNPLTWNISTS